MKNSVYLKSIALATTLIASLCCLSVGTTAYAQSAPVTPAAPTPSLEAGLTNAQPLSFAYNRERPDPFFPFLTQEIIKAEAKAKAELTGTQKFEPAQLTLVAIVSGKQGFIAMAQDSSGMGYVLRQGTKIGEVGKVIQITRDKVILEQVKNVTGERTQTSRKVEMTLNKEGEK